MDENRPEVICNNCGWTGDVYQLKKNDFGDDICPNCNSTDIEDYEIDESDLLEEK